jgi:hypothetical protein
MTPTDFRAALEALHWPGRYVAEATGYHPSIAAQWASGRSVVPADVATWLRRLVEAHRRIEPPRRDAA